MDEKAADERRKADIKLKRQADEYLGGAYAGSRDGTAKKQKKNSGYGPHVYEE